MTLSLMTAILGVTLGLVIVLMILRSRDAKRIDQLETYTGHLLQVAEWVMGTSLTHIKDDKDLNEYGFSEAPDRECIHPLHEEDYKSDYNVLSLTRRAQLNRDRIDRIATIVDMLMEHNKLELKTTPAKKEVTSLVKKPARRKN